ncbi:Hypothetical predicted protein [Paramuricea clavata]|uniref:Uncharacterized protein n=1 Tax=Paramuricea clavata TaxID=317549 RepID=A0A7D9LDS7_PARCT|nr:Hypothetical predicted protein [Paramuricea clavata]
MSQLWQFLSTRRRKILMSSRRKKCFECGKWVILENIACRSNDNKHAHQVTIINSGIIERKFVVSVEEEFDDDDEEFSYTIMASTKTPQTTIKIANVPVPTIIDTGSSVNILNYKHLKKINQQNPGIQLQPTTTKKSRRLPHSMRKKVNQKLHEMEEQGIIEKVKGVTPWLSPLIPIPKKGGDLRLVLDTRIHNQALKRRRVQFSPP